MRIKMSHKLYGGFGAILLFLIVVTVTSFSVMSSMRTVYGSLVNRVQPGLAEARALEAYVADAARTVNGYLVTGDPAYRDEFRQAESRIDSSLTRLSELTLTAEGTALLAKVKEAAEAYLEYASPIFQRNSYTKDEAARAINGAKAIRVDLFTATADFVDFRQRLVNGEVEEAQTTSQRGLVIVSTTAALALVFGLFAAFKITRQIVGPAQKVAEVALQLADGDLTVEPIHVTGRDELAEMALAVNRMVENLRDLMHSVGRSVESIQAAAEQLNQTAEESAATAETAREGGSSVTRAVTEQAQEALQVQQVVTQLEDAIRQIASGATETTTEVQHSADLLDRMVKTLTRMVTDATEVAAGAREAAQTARLGAADSERAVEAMGRIRQAVDESSRRLHDLQEVSIQIGSITETIAGIANQTNLLALNAAIEAARAGEHGLGFAVVADEVRKLAERSSLSAKEIANLVQAIQSRTATVAQTMEVGSQEAQKGSELADQAGSSLRLITETVDRAALAVGQIATTATGLGDQANGVVRAFSAVAAVSEENTAAAEEMAASADQVLAGVGRISALSQSNAAAAEEVTASVEEMASAAEEVASAASSMAVTARDLHEKMGRFRL